MEYLVFIAGYGWCKPAASNMQFLQDMQIHHDPKKGLQNVKRFIGACIFYWLHVHNFTYSSAPLTDLVKKTNPWRWTHKEEDYFQELKKKFSSTTCLGIPRPMGEIILMTDACDVEGGVVSYSSSRSLTPLSWLTANFTLQV